MGKWTHAICQTCWNKRHIWREPYRSANAEHFEPETCCFCGEKTKGGIYIREDPKSTELHCGGNHGKEDE